MSLKQVKMSSLADKLYSPAPAKVKEQKRKVADEKEANKEQRSRRVKEGRNIIKNNDK